ncbi:thioredoxin [Neomoorella mulderi]|uniref:Thioredoxin n=1 Tax=Moorella mulderi DSM 14980 TaxID=1122241 RepID=A0A151AXT5_9FIRM|nr:thioredoxin [Moorella mulderi]KYH32363.1 thioredoxin-1 [Moorella mulderi DSM 14980]
MAAHNIVTLTDANFKEEVLSAKPPVLVDFWAAWCGPCRMIAPVVEQLAGEYEGKIKVAKLNVDEYPSIASDYGIMSIPTLLLFKNGEVVSRLVGYQTKDKLVQVLEKNL